MNRFDDEFSTTNVSLLDDESATRRITTSPLPIKKLTNDNKKEKFKSGLKHQETTVDGLKKENFDLRMSLYYYEERINQMSTENIDNITKENKSLKAEIQTYLKELKTYKKMILELNQAVEILQNKPCPLPHGMTTEEKEELENTKKEVEEYQDENVKLRRMVQELAHTEKNSSRRSKNSSTSTDYSSSSDCNIEEHYDIQRKYKQTKLKLEEQQRMLKQTRHYDRDRVIRQLEDDLTMERQRVDSLQVELDKYTRNLHETKQQLRNKNIEYNQLIEEIEDLRSNNDNMGTLIDNARIIEEENYDLLYVIQQREEEIDALQAEVSKLLAHVESHPKEPSEETNERIISLEATLQETEDEIEMLRNELKSINESHDQDIEALEQHVNNTQVELEKKDQENKQLLIELEQIKQEFRETLAERDQLFMELEQIKREYEEKDNELVVSKHDKKVSMATIEGDLMAIQDIRRREKIIYQEETDDLNERIQIINDQLKEKENQIIDLTNMLNSRNSSEKSYKSESSSSKVQEKMIMLENKIKEYQERLKREQRKAEELKQEQRKAEEQLAHQNNANRVLKQKLFTANQKYNILNGQVDTKNASGSKSPEYSRLYKLNEELKRELEDKDLTLEKERQTVVRQEQDIEHLTKELNKRMNQLTRSLSDRDQLKEQGELMGHVLLEQITGNNQMKGKTSRPEQITRKPSKRRIPMVGEGSD